MTIPKAAQQLDEVLGQLDRDHLIVLEVADLAHLVTEPEHAALAPLTGPTRPGVDDLAATLGAAKKLPPELTVRVVVPPGAAATAPAHDIEAAFRSRAAHQASVTWRDGATVRNLGHRQLPIGLAVSLVSAIVAYGAGYLAASADTSAARGLLLVTAGLAITIAWVVSWMVIEASMLDWRPFGRLAAAYELLARCSLEITERSPDPPR